MRIKAVYKALFLKEWSKLKWVIVPVGLVNLGIVLTIGFRLRSIFEFSNAAEIWAKVIHENGIYFTELKYSIIVTAVIVCAFQFIPETIKKRLRLLFHLPHSYYRSIYFMAVVGLTVVITVAIINLAGGAIITLYYFPVEVLSGYLLTVAPWFLAGIFVYLGLVATIIEPGWRYRVVNIVMLYFFTELFLSDAGYAAYKESLIKYIVLGLLYPVTIILPIVRFKKGVQYA